jgi:hypothetical protein
VKNICNVFWNATKIFYGSFMKRALALPLSSKVSATFNIGIFNAYY